MSAAAMVSGFSGLTIAPLLPWSLLAGLGAGALIIVVYAALQRASGTLWRLLALSVALLALLNPKLVEEQRQPLNDVLALVVDRSDSQEIGGRRSTTSQAVAELQRKLERFSGLEVRVVAAGGRHSRLFEARDEALSDVPPNRRAGTIMISDGQVDDVPKPAGEGTEASAAPLQVLLTGTPEERDRRLVVVEAPSYGMVGDPLAMTLRIEDRGGPEARESPGRAVVSVRRDGGPVQKTQLRIGRDERLPFVLDHAGRSIIEIEVEAGPEELTLRNNRAALLLNGVRDRLRVLLVSGEPHAGERTWRNLLKADPSVDLVHFTILRPPEKQDGTPVNELSLIAFPIRELFEIKLSEFDLIILDRYRRRGVLPHGYFLNIANYVEAGGALLEAVGPSFAGAMSLFRTPLENVLPGRPTGEIYRQGFKPRLAASGLRHPVTADLVPGGGEPGWGRWFRMIDADAERGEVLMRGVADRPLLILDRVGDGRVALLLSDHGWLWARGFEGGGPQAELLRRLAHWLMKEPELEEEDLRATAAGNHIDIVRRSLKPGSAPVTVTPPGGEAFEVNLDEGPSGRASARIEVAHDGIYSVTDGRQTTVVPVGDPNARELMDVRATTEVLQPAVRPSGSIRWLEDGLPRLRRVRPGRDVAGSDWIAIHDNQAYVVSGVEEIPLLPPLVVLILLLGGLMVAWYREGR
ncbi:MAG: hypothetical protein QF546_12870 [Alphaproteobacteria bacterium]|jgi:hypothetical protein|nr:hypothetical protein [Alphaproteobacteria bacterium]MDP7604719.1 hypothetical protein [Alphaproteobacteria bacterium]HJP22015.1 hypothetical protein [Alphaproteobacteria bacterium]